MFLSHINRLKLEQLETSLNTVELDNETLCQARMFDLSIVVLLEKVGIFQIFREAGKNCCMRREKRTDRPSGSRRIVHCKTAQGCCFDHNVAKRNESHDEHGFRSGTSTKKIIGKSEIRL